MPDRISKTQRWLDLVAYLVGRRMPVAVGELMERVPAYARKWRTGEAKDQASVRRMFERDKDELRALGVPIESVPVPDEQEAYRLGARDFFLPYLRLVRGARGVREAPVGRAAIGSIELAPEAAAAALEALRFVEAVPGFPYTAEARSAMRKLAFDVGDGAPQATGAAAGLAADSQAPYAAEVPLLFLDDTNREDIVERVRTLSEALLARKRVRFRYHGIVRGEATDRDVAGYGLMFQHGHWYLVGHDALREDIRVFRVERMETPFVNARSPKTPDYEIPDDFRLRDYLRREAWELGQEGEGTLRALVLFAFPTSLWAERNARGELIEARDDGSAVRAFDVAQVAPFLRWILSLEGDAVVLQPPELRQALRETAVRVAGAHRG